MNIQPYQFIKYNIDTSADYLERVANTGAVVCFDFEDGIMNPFEDDLCATLKEESRQQFERLNKFFSNNDKIKCGVRLNSLHSEEFENDLLILRNKKFEAVFLPKTESPEDVRLVSIKLSENETNTGDLIPVIESKKGLNNLEDILLSNPEIKKIAFGHCDYNLDIGAYPFFHHDSWEYWKWIAMLRAKTEKFNVSMINSPYLEFVNDEFFIPMINYISGKNFCGQITLTTHQSQLCSSEIKSAIDFIRIPENKNLISADKKFALDLISEFESYNKTRGLSKCRQKFISFQEYKASALLINDQRITKEICFVGGCFPVQYNIVFENLFHQQLKRKLEEKYDEKININIIRYERFYPVPEQIKKFSGKISPAVIIFHIRPEPFLRNCKFIYKYTDCRGNKKWSVNLPFGGRMSEKYDLLSTGRLFHSNTNQQKSSFHKFLVSANYVLGKLIGNERFALKRYYELIHDITAFCKTGNIRLIILGPNLRNNNPLEPSLCRKMDSYFSGKLKDQDYVRGFKEGITDNMNMENGIHVTQQYHDYIAEKLFLKIRE